MMLNSHYTLTPTIKHFHTEATLQFDIFLTLWYNRLFSHSKSFWIDRLVFCSDKKKENEKNTDINAISKMLITQLKQTGYQ